MVFEGGGVEATGGENFAGSGFLIDEGPEQFAGGVGW
jgi:hypothetical protein